MLKIKLLFSILFLFTFSITAQKSVNDYKYIIVPSKFKFQSSEDQYQLNSLTKFLFNKYGYTAFISNEVYPNDYAQNKCLALTAHLRKDKNMFITKMNFDLINCNNEVVFSTKKGFSKEKEFKTAYQNALRMSFNFIKELNYQYTEPENVLVDEKVEVAEDIKINDINDINIEKEVNENEEVKVEVIDDVVENQEINSNLLYAQEINNGYQLVDSTPKLVYILQNTSLKDVYFIKDKRGIIFKQNGKWYIEYYFNNDLIKRELSIKF